MKKIISGLLLLSLLPSSFAGAQPASLLGEEILSDLLNLNIQIENLRLQLESLERNSAEREQLLKDLEANRTRRETLLQQLSNLVDEQAAAYGASLKKWKFSTLSLSILSAALAGLAIYQGASK